jgi:effector-binding domain-containing protein
MGSVNAMETTVQIPIERRWVEMEPCIFIHAKKTMAQMPDFFREAFGKMYAYAGQRTVPGLAFGRYNDWSTDLVDFDAGVVVRQAIPAEGEIQSGRFGGAECLVATHLGPYSKMESVYDAMKAYMKEHELQPDGPPSEVYHNSPDEVPENELKTEVFWPVK